MVSSRPRPHFTPGKDPVPILQEAGWASGPVWTGGKTRPHRDSNPDRPARSSVAIPTELPGPYIYIYNIDNICNIMYIYNIGWKQLFLYINQNHILREYIMRITVGSRFTTELGSRIFGCKSNRRKTSTI